MKKFVSLLLIFVMLCAINSVAFAETGTGIGSGSSYTPDPKFLPYDVVGEISEGMAWYMSVDHDFKIGFINTQGDIVVEAKYDDVMSFRGGLAAVMIGDKWGFIDQQGREVVKPIYEAVGSFSEGFAGIVKNDKVGFIDKTGKEVISPKYTYVYDFSEGLAGVRNAAGLWGFIDKEGKEVISLQYEYVYTFRDGLAPFEKDEKWGFIDQEGTVAIAAQYDHAYIFSEGLAAVNVDEKWGFIDKAGKLVIQPKYDNVLNFSEGLAPVQVNELWGFIDKQGNEVIKPMYPEIFSEFKEGLAIVMGYDEEGYTMQGYIDNKGNKIYKFDYDFSASPFYNGIAVVADGGQGSFYIISNPLTSTKENTVTVPKEETVKEEAPKASTVSARPTASKVLVDGNLVSFEAYNINDNNYFKLRDLAMALNGSEKSFEVSWDSERNAINLEVNKAYTPVGGELAVSTTSGTKKATTTKSKIYLDGVEIELTAYNIGGNNYFKLRDIAQVFDFDVTWDGSTNTVGINTSASYVE